MPTPFRVRDQDDPGRDLGGWDQDGNIDVPGGVDVGGSVTAAGVDLPLAEFGPQDAGFMAWNGDPWTSIAAVALVNGTIYLQKIPIRRTCTPTKLSVGITSIAVTPTAGQSWAGIYSSTGVRLAQTALDALVLTSGEVVIGITPGELDAGTFVWAAILVNAATPPQLSRFSSSSTIPNAGPAMRADTYRSCTAGTGQTTLPTSITPASNSLTGQLTLWAGLWG